MCPINDIRAVVLITAWRRPGGKPLSEPVMVSLLTQICVTRHQWVNKMNEAASFYFSTSVYTPDLLCILNANTNHSLWQTTLGDGYRILDCTKGESGVHIPVNSMNICASKSSHHWLRWWLAKLLSEPKLSDCKLDYSEQISMKSDSKLKETMWKYNRQNGCPFSWPI